MKKAILLFCIAFYCFAPSVIAQAPCGFDVVHQRLLNTDPEYARTVEANEVAMREYIRKHPELMNPKPKTNSANRMMATYTIPVVVHVLHTGGAVGTIYNPSDAQIQGAISYLNQVYAGTWPGMTPFSAGGAAGDLDIQFAMAQRTPTCGATNGIDRVDASSLPGYLANGVNSSGSSGCPEITVKNFARWNVNNYYNIYVVNKIDGADGTVGQFVAGYAYFPGAGALDGTIMLATQMASGAKTLPHEIGHALNVHHPFNGSAGYNGAPVFADCPANADCLNQGDGVCDTDPIYNNLNIGTGIYSFACRSTATANICAPPNNYSINTESNFMSYTNCFTLFTNGQKARMTLAMALASRASLVSGSNPALTPCPTVINFGTVTSTQTESLTGTTTGCRTYRDYTYQMGIGTGASATATATLTYSGTATKGLDYDVTTNGNFTTPSDVLTFLSGSSVSQPFTVRIYEDGNIESAESIILDFNVNNGGGNALKGTDAPTFTLSLADNDVAPSGASSGTTTYTGTYTTNIISGSCMKSSKIKHRVQYIVTKSELNTIGIGTAGNLTAMRFRVVTKNSTKPFSGFTVALGNTTAIDLSTGFIAPAFTQVFSSAYTTAVGDNVITFTTPFAWDGNSNVLINICFENATADASDDVMEGNTPSGNSITAVSNYVSGVTAGCSLAAAGLTTSRPRMTFDYNSAGTPIETVVASVANLHMATTSNDYFYSNNNRLLMRLSGMNAQLGCVAATLEGAGTTWASYLGGQRSAKVYAVTPTTNIGTTTYTVSFYFDNAELAGKTPGTLRIAKTSAASVAASNAGNTISIVPTVTAFGTGGTIFTGTFTGFSRFFLIDAGVTLPVELVTFNGKLNSEKNTVLNWKTASEYNNRQFNIELSSDAINFALLGTVAADGNSATEKNYEYLHIKPQAGTTWYRLKQIDIDGHSKYSNIISVTVNKDIVKPFVYPVPSKDIITVNFGNLVNRASLEVLTSDMKIVKRETVNSLSLKKDINIQGLSKGVYFIKLNVDNKIELLRFVKE